LTNILTKTMTASRWRINSLQPPWGRRPWTVTILAFSCALPWTGVVAGETSQTETILIKGHYDNAVGTSEAASQGTIAGTLLQDVPLLRPGEVLETVPGLVVTQHSGDGKANQYFLRGYNLDHGTDFATSIDGVPVNMPTNAHGQGYSDLNYLIPELVERIDYFKGPYFAQAGDFSAAGVANIRYRPRLDQNLADLTLGSFGYRRALLAASVPVTVPGSAGGVARPDSDATVLGALELQNSNGPWTVPEALHKINGLMRLSAGSIEKGWSADGAYYDANWTSTDPVPLPLIQSGQLGRLSSLDPTDGGSAGRQILSGEWHNRDDQGYTRLSAFAQRYRLQLFSNFTFFELRPATGDQFEQAEHRDFFGAQVVQGWNHGVFGHDSITESGLQVRHDDVHVSLLNTEARIALRTVSDDQVSETETGLYVQNTTRWAPWLRTLAGLREQVITMNVKALAIPKNSGNASATKPLPKLSLIFGPWDRTEFFINAGKGFHSNDARGVIGKIDSTTGLRTSTVPALVGSTGKELGVRTEALRGLQSSLALWSLNSDSELVYNADSEIGSTSPKGASRRYGVEWNNHLILGRHFLFDADLAWTHARYATNNDNGQSGALLPNAVSKVALVRATVQHLGPWSAGLETRFIGPYPLSQDGSLTTPSALVTNLRLQRELSAGCGVSLDLLNLFNREYYDVAYEQDYRAAPSGPIVPNGITVHPGEPRELRATLKLSF
jgi:outer membrane receptor for Fe3+-dicitrate